MTASSTAHGNAHGGATASPFQQPRAVWAVAFACVVSFMGIGLVDPILPAIKDQLGATTSQTTLLFTSYLVVTAVAMLVTGWVSSVLGAKRTLVVGLALIVVFAALAGASGSINEIIGFRAGWGLGNALFIATSLAVIVGSASGGFGGAIILYETALGVGIATGPLVGGVLGNISVHGPFFGVAVLMFVALIASATLVPTTPRPAQRASLLDPIRALRHRALATTSVTGLLYNWGFFTILGYAPFLMGGLTPIRLGFVFFGWGILVALCAVFLAPWLKARVGTPRTLYGNLTGVAAVCAVIGIWADNPTTVIVAVIVSGVFVGVNNTLVTTAVMSIAPVPRPVASATYGFVRFIGGGLAPYVAGRLAAAYNPHLPYVVAAVVVLAGAFVLSTVHGALDAADREEQQPVSTGRGADEAAPAAVPGLPEEAVIAEAALEEDSRAGR